MSADLRAKSSNAMFLLFFPREDWNLLSPVTGVRLGAASRLFSVVPNRRVAGRDYQHGTSHLPELLLDKLSCRHTR
jgi:hypothetical protein